MARYNLAEAVATNQYVTEIARTACCRVIMKPTNER